VNEEWNEVPENPDTQEPEEVVQEENQAEQLEENVIENQAEQPERERRYDSYQFSSPIPPERPQKPPRERKPMGSFGKKMAACVALAVVFGLVAGLVFQAVNAVGNKLRGTQDKAPVQIETTQPVTEPSQPDEDAVSASGNTVKDVARSAMPSIVAITNVSVQEIPNYFGFGSQRYEGESSGSGIIVGQNETELLIATNNHVVSNATTLTVLFAGQEIEELKEDGTLDTSNAVNAQIKGTDEENDLAVIAVRLEDIPAEVVDQIKVCQIGSSEDLEVGDQVVAIGNALGYGQSVTAGYVSALDRKVTMDNITSDGLIQTDAAINPGNSGGALLNMQGELIGINAAKYASSSVEGMGYAIPVSTAEPILNELMNRETRYKVDEDQTSYIGISCKSVTEELSYLYDMPVGVLISELEEDGPAYQAGMQKRDIITKMDGQEVKTADELIALLEYYSAGEVVDFEVYRTDDSGEFTPQTISVTLGNKKDMKISSDTGETQQNLPWNE
jgi:serine protease Do